MDLVAIVLLATALHFGTADDERGLVLRTPAAVGAHLVPGTYHDAGSCAVAGQRATIPYQQQAMLNGQIATWVCVSPDEAAKAGIK